MRQECKGNREERLKKEVAPERMRVKNVVMVKKKKYIKIIVYRKFYVKKIKR